MAYMLSRNYKNSGPYELNALQNMAANGQLGDGNGYFVCKNNSKEWIEVTNIPEIKKAFDARKTTGITPNPVPPANKKPFPFKGKK